MIPPSIFITAYENFRQEFPNSLAFLEVDKKTHKIKMSDFKGLELLMLGFFIGKLNTLTLAEGVFLQAQILKTPKERVEFEFEGLNDFFEKFDITSLNADNEIIQSLILEKALINTIESMEDSFDNSKTIK